MRNSAATVVKADSVSSGENGFDHYKDMNTPEVTHAKASQLPPRKKDYNELGSALKDAQQLEKKALR